MGVQEDIADLITAGEKEHMREVPHSVIDSHTLSCVWWGLAQSRSSQHPQYVWWAFKHIRKLSIWLYWRFNRQKFTWHKGVGVSKIGFRGLTVSISELSLWYWLDSQFFVSNSFLNADAKPGWKIGANFPEPPKLTSLCGPGRPHLVCSRYNQHIFPE